VEWGGPARRVVRVGLVRFRVRIIVSSRLPKEYSERERIERDANGWFRSVFAIGAWCCKIAVMVVDFTFFFSFVCWHWIIVPYNPSLCYLIVKLYILNLDIF